MLYIYIVNVFIYIFSDVTSIPVQKFVADAGKNITLPCPGVNEHSLIDALIWKTGVIIAEYANGIPHVHKRRVSNIYPYVLCFAYLHHRRTIVETLNLTHFPNVCLVTIQIWLIKLLLKFTISM